MDGRNDRKALVHIMKKWYHCKKIIIGAQNDKDNGIIRYSKKSF